GVWGVSPHRDVRAELDADARALGAEGDLVAGGQGAALDALAVDEGAVPALQVDEQPGRALAARLGVLAAGVAVELGVEDHVPLGIAAEADHVLVDGLHGAGVAPEGMDEPEGHGVATALRRSMRMPTRKGEAWVTIVCLPPTLTSPSSSRCAA